MLRRLTIEGYGLIESAQIEFAEGATIFTGETGSGKTMLVGALDFALGARAGADVVRRGAARAMVTLAFDPDPALRARLAHDGFDLDPGEEGTIAREIGETGRSAVRLCGSPTTAGYVRGIRDAIAEIVGQHEAQRLLAPAYHLELLDRFAGPAALALVEKVAAAYAAAQARDAELAALLGDDRAARRRYEDDALALREIEEARLEGGEHQRLSERRVYLENAERIAVALHAAREALASDEGGASGALGTAASALRGVEGFDAELREAAQRAGVLQTEAGELAAAVARALDAAEYDPAELDAINARLETIERLERKYGGTLEEIVQTRDRARASVDEYEGRDRRIEALELDVAAAARELREMAAALQVLRARAATALRKRVVAEFGEIALASGRFEIAIEALDRIGPRGGERVEFLFAANAGEPARPLTRVASGGELSRVLLALVVALARARDADSALIFDEIDAGIGGATATAVGARIGELARRGQVVCVTHLAQLATWAQRHYLLDKRERKGETWIYVRPVEGENERETEIARMLSGESHDAALRHARAMLHKARAAARDVVTGSRGS